MVETAAWVCHERSDRREVRSDAGARSLVCMVVSTAPPSRLEARRRFGHHAEALMEMLLGCFLLGAATLAGLVFVHRPWPNRVDAIGFRLLPADLSSRWAADVAHLGSLTVLIAGVAVLCVVAAMSRNWMRALSCLIAPIAAVLIVQTRGQAARRPAFRGHFPVVPVGNSHRCGCARCRGIPRRASVRQAPGGRGGWSSRRGGLRCGGGAALALPDGRSRRCVRRSGCRVCSRWSSVVDPQPAAGPPAQLTLTGRRSPCPEASL